LIVMERFSLILGRLLGRIASYAPPRHGELVRGMMAELESIAHPAERMRFALGAITTVIRLALTNPLGVRAHRGATANGAPTMPTPTPGQLLRRHAVPFAVSLVGLTTLTLVRNVGRVGLQTGGVEGAPVVTTAELVLLALPHTLALTIPTAVFLAVLWVFTRLGVEGVLAQAKREPHGARRLITPVMGAALVLAALTLVSNTLVLPRTNTRLASLFTEAQAAPNDRTMTVAQLRDAARSARAEAEPNASMRAAAFEVEIHKKFALAAACLVLALAAVVVPLRFPGGGTRLMVSVSVLVLAGYYFSIMAGESLADREAISPFLAMWMANVCLLGLVLVLGPRSSDDAVLPDLEEAL